MRIIISHPGRQHVHRLIAALLKSHSITFYTTLWYKDVLAIRILGKIGSIKSLLSKRHFEEIESIRISMSIFPELIRGLLTKLLPKWSSRWVFLLDRFHDNWVRFKIRNKDFDLIIGYENASYLSFKVAKKRDKITVLDLAHVHHSLTRDVRKRFIEYDSAFQTDPNLYNIMDRCKTLQYDYVDYILVLSEISRQSILNSGISANKVKVVNLGFETSKFIPKSEYDFSIFKVLYVGSLSAKKGVKLLVQAFQQLNLENGQLILVGSVPDDENLSFQVPNVMHYPFMTHDALSTFYKEASVFVMPSYLDSWGMVVLESMACGTPVIVSENTGSKDAVLKGGGYVIPTGDLNSLKERLSFLYSNRESIEILGRKAAEIAQQYTWQLYSEKIRYTIKSIMKENEDR